MQAIHVSQVQLLTAELNSPISSLTLKTMNLSDIDFFSLVIVLSITINAVTCNERNGTVIQVSNRLKIKRPVNMVHVAQSADSQVQVVANGHVGQSTGERAPPMVEVLTRIIGVVANTAMQIDKLAAEHKKVKEAKKKELEKKKLAEEALAKKKLEEEALEEAKKKAPPAQSQIPPGYWPPPPPGYPTHLPPGYWPPPPPGYWPPPPPGYYPPSQGPYPYPSVQQPPEEISSPLYPPTNPNHPEYVPPNPFLPQPTSPTADPQPPPMAPSPLARKL